MALIQKIKKKHTQRGYTIIEVMIVISVSAIVFAAAVAGYSRQNQRTEFANAVRDIESTIQDILNDVSTGYYPKSNTFACTRAGGGANNVPELSLGSAEQGTNQDCIFLGKAVKLKDADLNSSFTSHTLLGLRNSSSNDEVPSSNVDDAENRIIPQIPELEGAYESHNIRGSIDIPRIVAIAANGAESDVSGFAVVSGFGHGEIGGAGATTSQVSIASIRFHYNFSYSALWTRTINQDELNSDVVICIEEAGGDREASIKIGAGSQTNIETMIDDWEPECE